jgi:multiple sugar transport system permease protein
VITSNLAAARAAARMRGTVARRPVAGTFEQRRRGVGILFVAPALVVLAAILGYPILRSLILAMQHVRLASGHMHVHWIGWDNYAGLLSDDSFALALRNTILFSLGEVVLVTGIGLGAALLLNHRFGRHGILRILLIIPWAIAPVANAVLWKWILNANYGVLNAVLKSLGLIDHYVVWLGQPTRALTLLLLVDVWKSVPFIALLFLAGLQRIPRILYRAAILDGASGWQRFRFVTLPSLRSTITIVIVLQTIWSLRVFDLVFVLTRGGPADGTVLLNFLAYRVTFNFLNIGSGAAIANVIFAMSFLLALLYIWLLQPSRKSATA